MSDLWVFLYAFLIFMAAESVLLILRSRSKKQTQQYLINCKKELASIAQLPLNNPYPLIQIDKDGNILYSNIAASDTFPDLKDLGTDHPILKGVKKSKSREISYNNKIFYQTIVSDALSGDDTFIVYFSDITERKSHEIQLEQAYKKMKGAKYSAEQAKEARGQFLANMSHELRTPMNGIIGLSDIMQETQNNEECKNLAKAIHVSACNLLYLLNDILDFSKIEAGEFSIESIPFNLSDMIKNLEVLNEHLAREKGLIFSSSIAENVPDNIISDPARFQQILNNLISNAIKFTDQGFVKLTVGGENDGDKFNLRICVSDSGIGIPEEKRHLIFEKFQQADTSTARKYGGTGLGLSITKCLCAMLGGTIGVDSKEGKGSSFTINIPVNLAKETAQNFRKGNKFDSETKFSEDIRILLVDDHPVNLLFLREMLKTWGFQNYVEASSGAEALEVVKHDSFDLIFMDYQMPKMDGLEATKRIRELSHLQKQPIIIGVTADAMKGAKEKALRAGMNGYISKPIHKNELYSALMRNFKNEDMHNIAEESVSNMLSSSENNSDVIDWERIDEFTDGDPAARIEVINIFSEHLKNDLGHLLSSYQEKNYEEWDGWVHKLYGACSHIGANSLAKLCDHGQTLFPDRIEEIPNIHQAIIKEYSRVQQALR